MRRTILGQNLQAIRRARGMSPYDLANQAGVDFATIKRIERNEEASVNPKTFNSISTALGVTGKVLELGEFKELLIDDELISNMNIPLLEVRAGLSSIKIKGRLISLRKSIEHAFTTLRDKDQIESFQIILDKYNDLSMLVGTMMLILEIDRDNDKKYKS